MFKLNGFDLTITRGDTASIEFTFTGDAPSESDRVIAAMKPDKKKKDTLWEKTLERTADGKYVLRIESQDTEDLKFGNYWYDIRVLYEDGEIVTPMEPARFTVGEVVTNLPDDASGGE